MQLSGVFWLLLGGKDPVQGLSQVPAGWLSLLCSGCPQHPRLLTTCCFMWHRCCVPHATPFAVVAHVAYMSVINVSTSYNTHHTSHHIICS
jgi:hypothetical protein